MEFSALNTKSHNRADFDCGVTDLNSYLQRFANQDQKRHLSKIYVLAEGETIIGYYSLSAHSVARDELPDDIKIGSYHNIPFLLLGRLAVDKNHQGKGYGDALIAHAFKITEDAAEKVGILGIIVDAKDENTISFYEGFGFKRLSRSNQRLVLPISAMRW
jgi:GNAT superfamily N-acetyltransferase